MVAVADRSNQPIFKDYPTPWEWPWPIAILVMEARRIISYFEIPEDKRPPRSIWHSADKSSEWVKKAFDIKGEGGGDNAFLNFDDAERQ